MNRRAASTHGSEVGLEKNGGPARASSAIKVVNEIEDKASPTEIAVESTKGSRSVRARLSAELCVLSLRGAADGCVPKLHVTASSSVGR